MFQSSLRLALKNVVTKVSKMHLPRFDWFHQQQRTLSLPLPEFKTSAPIGSIINLLNGTLGSGILAMPLMFSLMGWVLGLLALTLTAILGVFTTSLMVRVGIAERTESYHMSIRETLGKRWMHVFQLLIIVGVSGALMAYLMLIGDFTVAAVQLISPTTHVDRKVVIACIAIGVVLPLSLLRRVKSLAVTGFMVMLFVLLYVIVMTFKTIDASSDSDHHLIHNIPAVHTSLQRFFTGLPLAVYASSCHASVYPVFHEMKDRSHKRFMQASVSSHFLVWLLCSASG